jgi:peptidoglycan/LPS O-acetylase OafA/YrhL
MERAEIPALTGLRFVAAATIVLAHFDDGSGATLELPNTFPLSACRCFSS